MKRILSIFLCVAMLASMLAMAVSAYDVDVYESIDNENVMSFKITNAATGEETTTFAPGDEIIITAHMDSIWGDPDIEDDIVGYEGNVLPGAYGMALIASCLVFDENVFDPKAGKDIKSLDSTINNAGIDPTTEEEYEMVITKTSLSDARNNGAYTFLTESDTYNGDEDRYAFFTGSGDICQWKLVVKEGATSGTYKLPIGAYCITDLETGDEQGLHPRYNFFGKWYADIGHSDSQLNDRPVQFVSPTDEYVAAAMGDDAGEAKPANGAYLTININGEGGEVTPPNPPVVDDPMSFEFAADDAEHVAGDKVDVTLAVKNNEGIDQNTISSQFQYDNTALKLLEVSTSIEGLEIPELNYEALNSQGKYEDLGKLTNIDCFFDGSASVTEDVTLVTLTFEVLPTAAGAQTVVTGFSNEAHVYPDAVIKLAANHTHSFEEVTVPATCTVPGYTDTVCSCGLSYRTAKEAAKGHTASTTPTDTIAVPATCTERGYTTTKCSVCGGAAKVVYTDALGHSYETVKSDVTCATDGYTMQKCKTCGHETEKTDIVEKLNHTLPSGDSAYGPDFVAQKPTTSAVGYMGRKCSLCGDIWKHTEIPMLDILWGDNNMDNKINISDVSVLLKHLAKWSDLYISIDNADVNHDGRINALDASKLLKYIAKWPDIDLSEGAKPIA